MLQSLDIVTIQVQAEVGHEHVRRCKQIVEIVDIDPVSKEILTNEVFRWDPAKDEFYYSGKSYVLERIRGQHGMSKEEMMFELKRRIQILEWMKDNNIRAFKDVARIVASYLESPQEILEKISRKNRPLKKQPETVGIEVMIEKQDNIKLGGSSEDSFHVNKQKKEGL
jgi:flagellar protein FlaI